MHHFSKKTKIIATIGPGSENKQTLTTLFSKGVDICRTNMSHDDQGIHEKRIKLIRSVAKKEGRPIAILQDLSGPKIRIGDFESAPVELIVGKKFILSGNKDVVGDVNRVYFNYPHIEKDIKKGMIIMLDDGKKKLVVEKVIGVEVHTKVLVGGTTKSRRGVNIPGAYLSIDAMTTKDKSDLSFGIKMGVDFVALSFVRTAKDIENLRTLIKKAKGTQAIIAKIETQEAVDNIDEIIASSDTVMVARGDLAVEIGPEKVPTVQKMIIRKCNELGKPVVVATQMLESMINAPVPTRAEVSDVANAIFDGADAVMLSEETALGKYPVEAVDMMNHVALQVEKEIGTHRRLKVHSNDIVDSVSSSVVHNAEDVGAKLIVALTETGSTPRMIARYKPQQPVVVLTPHESVVRQSQIIFGCYPLLMKSFTGSTQLIKTIGPKLIELGLVKKGDSVVVSAGVPFGTPGTTNMLMILKV
ncbi:MAG: pyruvate kinase [Candidatus Pacebacteria bacterium]|nr:pyruvate kinase [Candidatus Paceibacterota bacterium]